MRILRTWKRCSANAIQWTIWDRGDELWEMKGGEIRHFSLINRVKEGDIITEVLQLQKESPIPLEAIRQQIQGWQVEESQIPCAPASAPAAPAPAPPSTASQKARVPLLLRQAPAFLPDTPEDASSHPAPQQQFPGKALLKRENIEKTKSTSLAQKQQPLKQSHHDSQKQQVQALQEEHSEQPSYTLPNELWSSLSQWIPPNALFQPSLHHQAFLESSGTQGSTYPCQTDLEKNSQPSQAERQYVRQAHHSRPYRPKPSGQPRQVSTGPLFI